MICTHCRKKDHKTCLEENKNKTPSSCDCQHRVTQKTIVLPPVRDVVTFELPAVPHVDTAE